MSSTKKFSKKSLYFSQEFNLVHWILLCISFWIQCYHLFCTCHLSSFFSVSSISFLAFIQFVFRSIFLFCGFGKYTSTVILKRLPQKCLLNLISKASQCLPPSPKYKIPREHVNCCGMLTPQISPHLVDKEKLCLLLTMKTEKPTSTDVIVSGEEKQNQILLRI